MGMPSVGGLLLDMDKREMNSAQTREARLSVRSRMLVGKPKGT